ncbi:MAG: methyltransferase domain-containing protein [Candidatus Andeanibacterium colombiense]|uniref:Methyltransferase domain-containing protein n=1 Tax=Candidatus Andeanibacterium colombiense TaxID=3121345 RepID=A0AAJ6BPV8_9SPHN|nr:MAG: methyltransferase domain-containing protein [Sphingomonadaceae bacterium]
MSSAPPTIFANKRRMAIRNRMLMRADPEHFLLYDMVEDVIERLAFLRHEPKRSLIVGDTSICKAGKFPLAYQLDPDGGSIHEADIRRYFDHPAIDLEQPVPHGPYDLIACFGLLDTVNDLPGALIHMRDALNPGGLFIAQFPGAGSLPRLRAAMLAADGDRPAARMHPAVDVRAGAQLLQRCGFADPVADSRHLDVRYSSLRALVSDLRGQGLTSALASPAPPLTRAMLAKAEATFMDGEERVTERFEILTLSGWKA